MVVCHESVSSSRLVEGPIEHALESRRWLKVSHRTTGDADEVVVVRREILGQLEAGTRVGHGHNSAHRASLFKHLEIAVERALGQPGLVVDDLGDGQGPVGGGEGVDELPTPAGVALPNPPQPLGYLAVYVSAHGGDLTA